MTIADPVELFSHTVPESHAKLLAAAEEAGAEVEEHQHPLTGPEGEPLRTAVARLGPPDATTVVVLVSGTHGIEGYAGSAIQIGALRTAADTLPLADDLAIVAIHQINPWGAAWSRKENEGNQELLRHYRFCHDGGRPNPVFDDFRATLRFHESTSVDDLYAAGRRMRELFSRHDPADVQAALVRGQRDHADSITYHGGEPAWSKRVLDDVLARHLAGAERVALLDLHTAVGPYGEAVVLDTAPEGSLAERLVPEWFGELVPWGEERTNHYGWIEEVVPGTTVVSATMEIGTETLGPNDQVIFPLDCWLHTSGRRTDPEHRPLVERYRRFFYPEEPVWMASTWRSARPRVARFVRAVAGWRH